MSPVLYTPINNHMNYISLWSMELFYDVNSAAICLSSYMSAVLTSIQAYLLEFSLYRPTLVDTISEFVSLVKLPLMGFLLRWISFKAHERQYVAFHYFHKDLIRRLSFVKMISSYLTAGSEFKIVFIASQYLRGKTQNLSNYQACFY